MFIQEIMTSNPRCCSPHTNLAEAVALMWTADCGILPVIEENGKLSGVVTDRDMIIAAGTRNLRPSDVHVADVMNRPALTCKPGDPVDVALDLMASQKVRRLPVVDETGGLLGIVTLDDIVIHADKRGGKDAAVICDGVLTTLQSICTRRRLQAASAVAA